MNVKKALCNVHGTWKAFYKCQQYLSQLLQLKKKKKKRQNRRGQGRGSQTMVHGKKPSHYKEVSQKRKRMTFLYHESREQTGRSRPGRKSEHNEGCCTEILSR